MKKFDYKLNTNEISPLPNNTVLEKMVLGLLLDLPVLINQVHKFLVFDGIFYDNLNEMVWVEIDRRFDNNDPISFKDIASYFKHDKELSTYILSLYIHAGNPSHLLKYCLKLNEYCIQRNIIRITYHLNSEAVHPQADSLEILGQASEGLDAIYRHLATFKTKGNKEGIDDLKIDLQELENNQSGLLGLPSSLADINEIIRGYRKGNVIILGASTGEGKTTFALQECLFLLEQNVCCGYFSLEMTQPELFLKLACARANISVKRVLSGSLSFNEKVEFDIALDWFENSLLKTIDTPAMKIGEVKAMARMWVKNNDCKFLVIDHLHLMNGDVQYSNSEQKFTDLSNQIKELSKELKVPILTLVQLARKELNDKRMHQATDLKYAGGIEQAADVVLFIFRPILHGIERSPDGKDLSNVAHIYTGKTRLLPGGKFNCEFDGLRFRPLVEYAEMPKQMFEEARMPYKENPF